MKRAVLFLVTVIILLISACSRKSSGEGTQQIAFLHYFSGNLSGGINELVKSFNENHEKYRLIATPLDHEAFKTSIRITLKEGTPPDIYSYWAGARVESVKDDLEPLDDIWKKFQLDRTFSPGIARDACTYDGHKYLIPITQHYVCFFYHKKTFKELGIKPPDNWEELLAACEKIKRSGRSPFVLGAKSRWPAQFWFDYLLLRTSPAEYRKELLKGYRSYKDPEVAKAFRLWNELIAKGYFYPGANSMEWDTDAVELFVKKKASMMLMGTWVTGILNSDPYHLKEGEDYDFFAFPIVTPGIPVVSLGPVDGLIIPRNALNKEGARKALVYLSEVEPQKLMSLGSGAFSPSVRVSGDFYSEMHNRILNTINRSQEWAFNYDLSTPPEIAELGLNLFREFLEFPEYYPQLLGNLDTEIQAVMKNAQYHPDTD